MDTRVSPAVVVVVLVLVAAILLAIWYYMNAAKPAEPSDVEIIAPPSVDNPPPDAMTETGDQVPAEQPADAEKPEAGEQPATGAENPAAQSTETPSGAGEAPAPTEPSAQPGD